MPIRGENMVMDEGTTDMTLAMPAAGGVGMIAPPGAHRAAPGETEPLGQFGARQLGNVLRRRKGLILSIVLAVVGLVGLFEFFQPREYQAVSVLSVEAPLGEDGAEQAASAAETEMRIETETQTLASHGFARAIVSDLALLDKPAFAGAGAGPGRTAQAGPEALDAAANMLLSMVQVTRVPRTQLINIAVTSPSPSLSALIANRVAQIRQTRSLAVQMHRQDGLIALLTQRAQQAGAAVRSAEQAVADFRRANGMLVGAGGAADLTQINQIMAEAAVAGAARAESAARVAQVDIAAGLRATPDSATSPLLVQQQQRYAELLQRRAELSSFYGPGHPELANVLAQITEVKHNMDAESARVRRTAAAEAAIATAHDRTLAQGDASGAAARESQLRDYLGGLTATGYRNTAANVRLAALERAAEAQRDLYLGLVNRLKLIWAAAGDSVTLSLQSAAQTPSSPVSPTPVKSLMVAFVGSGMLALILAFALEMADRRLRSAEQIRRHFGLPTFAMIPLHREGLTPVLADNPVFRHPESVFAEATRVLQGEVARRHAGDGGQIVLITSPLPGDGKSSVALCLGAAAIEAGKRVVIVDLDVRRPSQLQAVQRERDAPDLLAYFRGDAPIQRLLPAEQPADSDVETLAITTLSVDGPVDNPASVITAARLARLFDDLRDRFDLIIVDAPPVLAVHDASTMSALADTTLMVVRWGHTVIEEVETSLDLLRRPVTGVVFDGVDYAAHARGRYGDAIQFLPRAAAYYAETGAARAHVWRRLLARLGLRSGVAA
jgi:uncharacterized protein involved in exopolysaccharide biosynthesis/Mrp family chromosome partitioning ATPase